MRLRGFVFVAQWVKRMLRVFRQWVVVFALLPALLSVSLSQESPRKVIAKTAPSYPELAKRMHVTGKVRVEVDIAPSGAVSSARLVGGNPVFEKRAIDAIKKWRFEPASKETKAVIVLEFAGE